MRLTADLIQNSISYLNPLKERELDLRGRKIPLIENLGVARDHDALDLTDNDIQALSNFPQLPRINTLLLARNRVAAIRPLHTALPNLTTLALEGNRLAELADLEPLGACPRLAHLVLVGNPVCSREHYRLWVVWLCPRVRFLDYRRVRDAERVKARELFGEKGELSPLAERIMGVKSRAFDPNAAVEGMEGVETAGAGTDKIGRVKLTDKERERVKKMIAQATSLSEIARLERELNEGRIPGGVMAE